MPNRDLTILWKTSQLSLVHRVLLVVVFFGFFPIRSECSKVDLSIGYLSSLHDDLSLQSEQEIYNALQMAIEDRRQIMPNFTLSIAFKKIGVDQSVPAFLEEVMRSGAVTVFGHADMCDYIPSVLKSRNRIVISNVCGDEKLSNKELYPTFLRTRPSDAQMVESILALLQHYELNSFALVVQNTTKWRAIADSLEKRQAFMRTHNITVHHRMYFEDNRLCCTLRQPCCHLAWSHDVFKKTRSSAKVYIFLGEKIQLRIFVQTIQDLELSRANQYLIIACDSEAYSTDWAISFLEHPREIQKKMDENHRNHRSILAESRNFNLYSRQIESAWLADLPPSAQHSYTKDSETKTSPGIIMVVRNIANEQLNTFTRRLRSFSRQKNSFTPEEDSITPSSIYAAYAYDAITVYAQALSSYVKNMDLSSKQIEKAAQNGLSLFKTIIEIQNFPSVRGGVISFDLNGDTEDSYIAVGSRDLFVSKNKSLTDVSLNIIVPFGYFRGTVFHPTMELNQTVYLRLVKAEENYNDEFLDETEVFDANIYVTIVVAHLLALAGMVYTFAYQAKKMAAKMNILTIRVVGSTESELTAHLLEVKQMRVMNYNFHAIEDDWRMKVWNKNLNVPPSWPTLDCETFAEIRRMQRLQHDNVNPLVHAIIEPARICLVSEFQARKSLLDILSQPDVDLDFKTIISLALDLASGMSYIHSTKLNFHGNLKSSNCLVDLNWNLKITDFGLLKVRKASNSTVRSERDDYFNLLWRAPELLRNPSLIGNPEGDIYSFAIILHELVCRQGPFAISYDLGDPMKVLEVVNQVKQVTRGNKIPVRPPIETLNSRLACMFPCMVDCWAEDASERPDFSSVYHYLIKAGGFLESPYKTSILMGDACIEHEKQALEEEIQEIDAVLHRIVPKSVANSLANGLPVETELWENVTVFEADLVGFTEMAAETTPLGTMILLDDVYTLFDSIARGYDVCKVGTIGDAYIVVSGIHSKSNVNSAGEIASMALEVVDKMKKCGITHRGKPLVVRIGVHTGQVATGVVGSTMPTYSIFGDTVSVASRLEATSSELRIQISETSYKELQQIGGYITEERTDAPESFKTYWLIGHTEKAVQRRESGISLGTQSLCNRQSVISLTQTDIFIDPTEDDDRQT